MAPALKREVEALGERGGRRLGDAHVGADRDVHADEAGGAREHRADQEADRGVDAEEEEGEDEDHDADDADGGVLAAEIGRGAFAHGGRDLLHAGGAGVGGEQAAGGDDAVDDRQKTGHDDQPE